ncbi:hypothetical protein [Streptomyces purpurascens]|uniref:hypothetical protein n=1 Tax=Streptomyces purpurascens TaxID=1924 RepID=UPI003C30683D
MTEPRPGPEDLGDDDLGDGWTGQMLFQMIASLMPGARAVLRRIAEMGGTASYDEVQQYFADRPTDPIPRTKIGGSLTSVRAVQRRVGPAGANLRSSETSEHGSHRPGLGGRAHPGLRPCRQPPGSTAS